jgi:hypothetical protein
MTRAVAGTAILRRRFDGRPRTRHHIHVPGLIERHIPRFLDDVGARRESR